MKQRILLIVLTITFAICYNSQCVSQVLTKVSADSLISNIDKYHDSRVEIVGHIVHICGVDGKKMKLQTENGAIIKISPKDSLVSFDTSFYKKRVKISGIVKEYRIEKDYIDKMEKEKTLLCHIDNTPCKDSDWVNYQVKKGTADAISKKDIEKLREIIKYTQKNYVSIITVFAEKVEIIAETDN
jgi:hypothetical protein